MKSNLLDKKIARSVEQLSRGTCHHPHEVLGPHGDVVRIWRPRVDQVKVRVDGKIVRAARVDPAGLWETAAPTHSYELQYADGSWHADPYAQPLSFGELDEHYMTRGIHYDLYKLLGARVREGGTNFAVWAPMARGVSLVGDFNGWDSNSHPMGNGNGAGVWELFVPGLGNGARYQFAIRTAHGELRLRADPYAHFNDLRPGRASQVWDVNHFEWHDSDWDRKNALNGPINIYEVHFGSWRRGNGEWLTYRELAPLLADYCVQMGFTHVELLPIMEHPLDESWGYQVTGFFAPTSRYGTPDDFQFFVDHLHQKGVGVFLDWVPGHFPVDKHALANFDGSHLYEKHSGLHPEWNTYEFDYGRVEVANFLIASALFWLDQFHVDGFRVDAVASILYLDYARKEGEWEPNRLGGNLNLEAVEFVKHLNRVVHERHPGVLMMAEESTSYPGVTSKEGLGFDLKWNMGWMNDTLSYFGMDYDERRKHQELLTWGMHYYFDEQFISVLSHDEVVHLKKSLIGKMPGSRTQQFSNVRLLISYMLCHPGKQLLFMGGEFGQQGEWSERGAIAWEELEREENQQLQLEIRELNQLYKKLPALWEWDFEPQGFAWVDHSDHENGVISYYRRSKLQTLLCVHNFQPTAHEEYRIGCGSVRQARTVHCTEEGGQCQLMKGVGVKVHLPALSTVIIEVVE